MSGSLQSDWGKTYTFHLFEAIVSFKWSKAKWKTLVVYVYVWYGFIKAFDELIDCECIYMKAISKTYWTLTNE